ncbi:MAG: flavohemoglobin expression-modulating QEGLA motif protein [Candidatus Curtissbacteria bacterium]|nr:flavohemoglobin expression-modulating QEGLA motif protein [Candidatus Curtissbacteria bacterium]
MSGDLAKITRKVSGISGMWNPVEIYTPDPTSLKKEKEKVFAAFGKDKSYNPKFTYSHANTLKVAKNKRLLLKLKDEVASLKPKSSLEKVVKRILYLNIEDNLSNCLLIEGIKQKDESKIAKAFSQKYPRLTKNLIRVANKSYERLTSPQSALPVQKALLTHDEQEYLKNLKLNARQIKEAFEWALAEYGILQDEKQNGPAFRVSISKTSTSIDVRDKSKTGPRISIPADREVTGDKLLELIGHEVEGHSRQSVNGQLLFAVGGSNLKIDSEELYEGLAKRYDEAFRLEFFGEESGTPKPFFVFATQMAQDGKSFFKIFEDQIERHLRTELKIPTSQKLPKYIDDESWEKALESAWKTTYRVMRGHINTKNTKKFAMTKDLSYLLGWLLDKKLVKAGKGYLNEAAILDHRSLPALKELGLSESSLPLPYKNVAKLYWEDILKPRAREKS